MALKAKKTEHVGPKKGRGAFHGRKPEAKHASNRRRREEDKAAQVDVETPDAKRTTAGSSAD